VENNKNFKTNNDIRERRSLKNWYQSLLGQCLLEQIKKQLAPILSTSFGYYAIQLGCESSTDDILSGCRVKHLFHLGQGHSELDVISDCSALPIGNDSTDLIILMHALSTANDHHALLREINRVLIPDGKLIIIDFNPISLWGLRHLAQSWLEDAPWAGHYYTARRLKDWASLLGFELKQHSRCGYLLPINIQKVIKHSRIPSKIFKKWFNFSAAINILVFEKNTIPITPVRKHWVKQQILTPKVARPSVGRSMKYDND